jgi:lysophospholipase L1-like esterase
MRFGDLKMLLVGDSILDNGPYVGEDSSVLSCVKKRFPDDEVNSIAVDGFTTIDVRKYLRKELPTGYDYVFLSVGGNDLIENQEILLVDNPTAKKKQFWAKLLPRHFRIYNMLNDYNGLVFVFNIYTPFLDESEFSEDYIWAVEASTEKFNRLLRFRYTDERIMDLHSALSKECDFVNTIEPSATASLKIADLIYNVIKNEGIDRHSESKPLITS